MDYFRKSREDSFMKLTIGNIRLFILLATFFLDCRDRANFPNCILVLKPDGAQGMFFCAPALPPSWLWNRKQKARLSFLKRAS
jgi:hypothetical protein